MSALRTLVKNTIKESFYGKKKKKAINFLTNFFISYKSDSKLSLIRFLTSTLKALISISHKKKH